MNKSKLNVLARFREQGFVLKDIFYESNGSSGIEYALIGSLISIVIVATLGLMNVSLIDLYNRIAQAFSSL